MTWAEMCFLVCCCMQLLWARVVMRKWLNMASNEPDYTADPDDDNEDDPESDSDNEGECLQ